MQPSCLGTLNNISALHLETISNSKITKKITKKNAKNTWLWKKRTLAYTPENWNKKVGSNFVPPQLGMCALGVAHYFATINVDYAYPLLSATAPLLLTWGLQISFSSKKIYKYRIYKYWVLTTVLLLLLLAYWWEKHLLKERSLML